MIFSALLLRLHYSILVIPGFKKLFGSTVALCFQHPGQMSGLEVVGIIGTLVGAFVSAAALFRKWRDKRQERKKQGQNQAVDGALTRSGGDIKQKFDVDFRRLGIVFARGDSKCLCKGEDIYNFLTY